MMTNETTNNNQTTNETNNEQQPITQSLKPKSDLIRAAIKTHGIHAPAQKIIEHVKRTHGVDVKSNLVNSVKHNVRQEQKPKTQPPIKLVVVGEQPKEAKPTDKGSNFADLKEVKKLAVRFGGLSKLRTVIDELDELERLAA